MPYILIVEGQEIPLTDEVAATDETIRAALVPFYPEFATADIKRELVNEVTLIKMVKKAGTKGISNLIHELSNNKRELNPALTLSLQLKQLEVQNSLGIESLIVLQPEINNAIEIGKIWKVEVEKSLKLLKSCTPISSQLPISSF